MSENEPDTTDTPQNEKETTKQTAPAKQAPEQPKKKAASARRTSRTFDQADKLKNVFYDIRGPLAAEAERMESEGHTILKLNTGNPAVFGFDAPDVIMRDMIANLPTSQGYSTSKGILPARVRWSPATKSSRTSPTSTSTTSTWATASPS